MTTEEAATVRKLVDITDDDLYELVDGLYELVVSLAPRDWQRALNIIPRITSRLNKRLAAAEDCPCNSTARQ